MKITKQYLRKLIKEAIDDFEITDAAEEEAKSQLSQTGDTLRAQKEQLKPVYQKARAFMANLMKKYGNDKMRMVSDLLSGKAPGAAELEQEFKSLLQTNAFFKHHVEQNRGDEFKALQKIFGPF